MSEYVSKKLRTEIARRANGLCEYCLCPASHCIAPFVVEHIHPLAKGGLTILSNLAFGCGGCNGYKLDKTEGTDSLTKTMCRLYNPRTDTWSDHFQWNADATLLVAKTDIDRTTILELHLNREGVINVRRLPIMAGLHPPERE